MWTKGVSVPVFVSILVRPHLPYLPSVPTARARRSESLMETRELFLEEDRNEMCQRLRDFVDVEDGEGEGEGEGDPVGPDAGPQGAVSKSSE